MIGVILIVLLLLALCGGFVGPWPRGYGLGMYGSGGLGLLLLIVIVLLLAGRI